MGLFNLDGPSRSQDLGIPKEEIDRAKRAIQDLSLPNGFESHKDSVLRNFDALSGGKYGPVNKLILISAGVAGLIGGFDAIMDAQAPDIKVFQGRVTARIKEIQAGMSEREKLEALVVPSLGD